MIAAPETLIVRLEALLAEKLVRQVRAGRWDELAAHYSLPRDISERRSPKTQPLA